MTLNLLLEKKRENQLHSPKKLSGDCQPAVAYGCCNIIFLHNSIDFLYLVICLRIPRLSPFLTHYELCSNEHGCTSVSTKYSESRDLFKR